MTFFLSCSCWSPENSVDSIETIYWCYSKYTYFIVVVVQLLSCVWLFMTAWTAAHQASLVRHYFPEFAQTQVHWVGDAIQPSHPLLCPSALALSFFQHQYLFQCISSSHQVANVLELQLQYQSFQSMNIQGWFPLRLTGLISLLSEGLSRVFSSPVIQKHQFFVIHLSLWSNFHIHTWLLEKP